MNRSFFVLIFSSLVLAACNAVAQPTPTTIPILPPTLAKPSIVAPTATLPPAPPGTPTLAPRVPTTAPVATAASSTAPVGKWQVFNFEFAPISALNKTQADTWLNKIAELNPASITFDGKTCAVSAYKRTPSTALDYFLVQFKTDPAKIGIGQTLIDVIQTGCAGTPFDQFVQLNPTTLVAAWDGVFFFFGPEGKTNTAVVPAPAPKRISFAPAATSASIQSNLAFNGGERWVIRVFAGQTLTLNATATNGKVMLIVFGADGDVYQTDHVGSPSFTGIVRSTQDYFVDVRAWGDTAPAYTLLVSIPPLPTVDPRPTPKRISFAPGATTATVQGNITANVPDVYVLRAVAGQVLAVRLSETQGVAVFMISGADGTVLVPDRARSTNSSGNIPFTQDYFIEVIPMGTPVVYSLQVTIPPLNLVPNRVVFQPGATSAVVQGVVAPNATDRYALRALAGQTMTIQVLSPNNQAVLVVWGEDGQALVPDKSDATSWQSRLPATQDYLIDVWSIGNANVGYSLHVDVPPK